jgi:serine/threonine protein kinase
LAAIGEGGFGSVYLVMDRTDGRLYALKEEKKSIGYSDKEREYALKYGNVYKQTGTVRIFDCFTTDDYSYIVMELCSKGSLSEFIKYHIQEKTMISEDVLFFFFSFLF